MFLSVEKVRVPRAFIVAVLAALGWLAFYASWLLVAPGGEHGLMVFADTAYLAPLAAAVGLAAWAAFRAVRGMRIFWALLAVSNASWLAAETLWSVRELSGGEVPFPWWTDVGYDGWYVLAGVAIVVAFRPSLRTVRAPALLDGLLAVGAVALVWWWLVLRGMPLGTDLGSLVGLVYPLLDLALLGLLVSTRLLASRRGTVAMKLVLAAVLAGAAADAVYIRLAVKHEYVSGSWVDIGWQVQACMLALAAGATGLGVDRRSDWARWRRPATLAPAAIVTGAGAVLLSVLALDALGDGRTSGSTLVACGALALLVAARLALLGVAGVRALRHADAQTYDASRLLGELRRQVAGARTFDEPFAVALVESSRVRGEESGCGLRLAAAARAVDVVARLDDGRFCIVMPCTAAAEASELADRLRVAAGTELASVGVVVWRPGDEPEDLLEAGERLLDAARSLGGNQVRGPEPDALLEGVSASPQTQLRQLRELAAGVDRRGHGDPQHSARVASLSRQLALELGLELAEAEAVELAGLLHALGKVAVSDDELASDPHDPLSSAELVRRIPAARHVAPLVAAQFECWDGSGTPHRLAGEEIPVGARIVAVAHELIGLVDGSRYGAVFSLTSALTEIWRHADRRFDPEVVSALFRVLREGGLEGLPGPSAVPARPLAS